ncbi:MAG: ligase-associated DNA damage response exonuclease [Proteobacteria bacterium]|nr:ligase-associated DNA damage response exonuclease [Burkholderiales bacterium]
MAVLELRASGLYCPAGDFHIDPWRPVDRAILTHAHADHARRGHGRYLAQRDALGVLRTRLGDVEIDAIGYREPVVIGGARVSLHPAGHVLGSAQVRVEVAGEIWVVTGDYKLDSDPTCAPFEPVRAHTLITESTFGLPVYRWATPAQLAGEIDEWWRRNAELGRASVVFAYAFGKAQRILAGVDASIGPIVCHGAVETLNRRYREAGVALPPTMMVSDLTDAAERKRLGRALVVAPPSAQSTPWMRRFPDPSDAFASGWMQLRGARRRRGVDRGFVMSDHADWPGLNRAIEASGAHCVYATHGYSASLARYLTERGLDGRTFDTREFDAQYGGDADDTSAADLASASASSAQGSAQPEPPTQLPLHAVRDASDDA